MPRVDQIHPTGTFANNEEARASLKADGDAAIVVRGVPRMMMLKCPCGCGDTLVLNLDSRSGPAWRLYQKLNKLTVYPSYWRDSHCGSHFVLWGNRILWCDWRGYDDVWEYSNELEDRTLALLPPYFVSYLDISDQLEETPWDVLQACRSLVRKKIAAQHPNRRLGQFCRLADTTTA